MEDDTTIWPTMEALLKCLEGTLVERALPECTYEIAFGQEAIIELCEECTGQAWVRLVTGFPVDAQQGNFPEPAQGVLERPNQQYGYQLEVGIARPHPVPSRAEPLTVEQKTEVARLQAADMTAIRLAICKCFAGKKPFVLGQFSTLALGGIVDGRWLVTVSYERDEAGWQD